MTEVITERKIEGQSAVGGGEEKSLVVYNDDFNTIEYVIEILMRVCRHNPQQAEQCTLLIHHKGKCAVRHGDFEFLKPMKDAICDAGIKAVIE